MVFETTPSRIKTASAADICDSQLRYRDVIAHTRNQKLDMSEQIPSTLDYIKSEYRTKFLPSVKSRYEKLY